MNEFPLPPDAPAGFSDLVSGDLWQRLAAKGLVFPLENPRLSIQYLRLKPNACRVFLIGEQRETADRPPQGILLQIYDDRERAQTVYNKEKTRRPLPSPDGLMTFFDESSGVVGLPFPNDPEIPELRRIYEPDRFRRLALELVKGLSPDQWRLQRSLTKFHLLAYKPGRRAVLRAKLKFRHLEQDQKIRVKLHLKVEKKSTAHLSIKQAKQISEATAQCKNFKTPSFLGSASNMCLFAHEWNGGSPVDLTGSLLTAQLKSLGSAIAEFHSNPLELPSHIPPQLISDEVLVIAKDLQRLLPESSSQIQKICQGLIKLIPSLCVLPSCLLHGDLHLDQFLIEGVQPVLLDFDRAGRGYASLDIGSMLEDLRLRGVTSEQSSSFLEGYRSECPVKLTPEILRVGRALAILRRASEPLRKMDSSWKEKLNSSLDECHDCLTGAEL
ncbi:MAG: aminoglycoside phosphotransferase family protein [Planctomycetota bacterium]|nr:aminoglycoside phosphotransferase family protein [Planctomycetota bacterium]